jgi:HicB-like protein involved in pilus formation
MGPTVAIKCKRIIDGKTYNTETATMISGGADFAGQYESGKYLYQTRFGAFFAYSYMDGAAEDDYETIEPLTPQQAQEWLEKNDGYNVELIERLFGQMPEAGLGEVKYTLRMPESLRDRLAGLAKANEQSLNAWIIRCLEVCAASSTESSDQHDIPPMSNLVGSNRTGWRTRGT